MLEWRLALSAAPAFTSADHAGFSVGQPNDFAITTSGSPQVSTLSESGALPAGVTFVDNGNGTGALSGTPTAGSDGAYPLAITATNGIDPAAIQSFTLTVGEAPTINSSNNTTFVVGVSGSFAVTTVSNPTATVSEAGTLPAGITFVDHGDGTGALSGTPAAGTTGTYTISINAANGIAPTASQTFTLSIAESPSITSADNASFSIGQANSFAITTSGFPVVSALGESGPLPAGVTFTDNGDGTGVLSGTPAAGSAGAYPVAFIASNGIDPVAIQSFTLTIDQAPAFTSADHARFSVGQSNSFTVTTSGFPAVSALTLSGTLPAGVTFIDNGDGTGVLSGAPAAASNVAYPITISATNGVGSPVVQSFTLSIDQPPAFASADNALFLTGAASSFVVTTASIPKAAISESGALPAGITFVDNGDGTAALSGTPSAAATGTYTITISATNGVDPPTLQTFLLTIAETPTFTSADHAIFSLGQPNTFNITTSGFPAVSTLTESGALPPGITLIDHGDGTGALSGTPGPGATGIYTITISASNGIGPPVTQNFTLTLDQAPAFASADNTTFFVGAAGSFVVATTSSPTATLSESGALPAGIKFVDNGDGTGALSGTPAAGASGTYAIAISAANGIDPPVIQTFTLLIEQAPSITSLDHASFSVGQANSFTITATGSPAVSTLSESGTLPSGVTFTDNGDGTATLSGTPNAGADGTYALAFIASNGIDPAAIQSFTLSIDQAPAFTSADHTVFSIGQGNSFAITTTGSPAVSTLSESGALPAGVTFVDNGDGAGVLSGAPVAGTSGAYPITISASNGVGSAVLQNFTLTVDVPSVTSASITSAASTSFTVGTAGAFTISTAGFPVATLTLSGALPSGVTFVDHGDGTATLGGTPAAGTSGVYTITLTATNGIGAPATQAFNLTINAVPSITSAANTSFTVGAAGTFTISTAGFPVVALTLSGALPSGVTFVDHGDGTATLGGTPAAGMSGAYPITISAANGVGPAATQAFTLTVNPAPSDTSPSITSAASASFTAGTLGAFTISTAGFPVASLTESGALPPGVTFVDNHDGTATLGGTPAAGTSGAYPITISATNGVGSPATQTFTLDVFAAASITSAPSTSFAVGTAGAFTISTAGFPAAAITLSGALPSGVTFLDNGDGTGTLSGTPADGASGAYTVTISASNGIGSAAIQIFTLAVDAAPSITSAASTSFTVGTAGAFTISTTGFPVATLTELGALPPGVTFIDNHDGTATLGGTPAAGTSGAYTITIGATNGVGPTATQTFNLTVDATPSTTSPLITSAANTSFTVGTADAFTISTAGFPVAAITESGALPSGVTFVDNGDGTATLSGTPAAGTSGAYTIQINATNGVGSAATQSFTLTVNSAPSITSASSTSLAVGAAGGFTISTTGFPVAAITESGSLPSGVTFVDNGNGTATLSGTPAAGASGAYTLTISAANGIGSPVTQTFTLTVNAAPSITSGANTSFTAGTAGAFTISTAGFPVATLTESGTLPSGITFIDNHDGTATLGGTPAAGTGGAYTIQVSATNGIASPATQTFTLTVNAAPSIASAPSTSFAAGASGTFTISTAGFPVATLTESGALPAGVTFIDNHDGTATLSGTPAAGASGAYTIQITATNGVGSAALQSFTLSVNAAPSITSAASTSFAVGAAGGFTISTAGFPAATLAESGALPSGVTFVDNGNGTATLSGTPAAGTSGAYTIAISASNGIGPTATQTFNLTVDATPSDTSPSITSAANTSFAVGTAGAFTISTAGFPVATLTESGALPSGVTFVDHGDGTATLGGTPAAGASGTFTLTINAANGIGSPATQTFTLTVNAAPSVTSLANTSFTVGTAGAFTFSTAGFPVATLTESGSLPSGVTFVNNNDGTATLSGTPAAGASGAYPIQVSATNGIGSPAAQTFTLTVNAAPSITSASSTSFAVGATGGFTISTAGFPVAMLTESGALPAGVTFIDNHDGTAALSGTPASGASGAYPITISATNGVGSPATQNFTLTVNAAPSVTSASSTSFAVGTGGTFTISTTGFPVATLTELGALPAGVTFIDNHDGTATLSGTPAAGASGAYTITISAMNGVGPPATQTFTLAVNAAPSITSASSKSFAVGAAGAFTISTAGFPVSAITESGALPSGVSFVDNGNGTATLSGTPAAGTSGAYTITISAMNGVGPAATQTFNLTVDATPSDTSPSITSAANTSFTVGTAGSFTISTAGFPVATLTESGSLPAGVTFIDNHDGTATLGGTPAAGASGAYTIMISATNGIGVPATQTFTLIVNSAASITSASSTSFTIGTAGAFTISTSDFPVATLTESGALPAGVTFIDNHDGTATLSGTPAAGASGAFTMTISATNGIGSPATQTFTLTVNSAPSITSASSASFTVGTGGTFTVSTTGFPVTTLTESGALPSGVTFVDNGNGTATLSGTPAAGTGGAHTITISATNGIGSPATQTFSLNVNAAPSITSATNTTFAVGTSGAFTISTAGFPAAAITESGALPSGVTFVDNHDGTATLSGTPAAAASGAFTLTIAAANGIGAAVTQTFTLTVNAAPSVTSGANTSFTVGTAGAFTISTAGFPVATLTESGALPSGIAFADNHDGTATLSGTPAAGASGAHTITISATNGIGAPATQTFTLAVNAAPSITSAASTSFAVGTSGAFTISTAGFPVATLTESGALPSGIAFADNHDGTATLSGTPAAGASGSYTIQINATNGIGAPATQTFTLTVNAAPSITSAASTSFTVGAAGAFTISTSGFPVVALTESGALPSGVTFIDNHDGTATLSGTPAAGTSGAYAITISASNGVGAPATQSFSLAIASKSQGSIGGEVFNDVNVNGQLDSGEPGLSGRQVLLDIDGSGTPGANNPSTMTDASGKFNFTNLAPGTYIVREVISANHGVAVTTALPSVAVAAGQATSGINIGNVLTSSLTPLSVSTASLPLASDVNSAYINAVYQALLGRLPDTAAMAYWQSQFAGGTSRETFVEAIWKSLEHRSIEIEQYYQTFLNRASDPVGKAYWIAAFNSWGTEENIIASFVTSDEYSHRLHPIDSDYISALYDDIDLRAADAAGLATWQAALQNGQTRLQVATAFIKGEESSGRLVDAYFSVFLHRAADGAGRQALIQALTSDATSLNAKDIENVGVHILAADEFFARVSNGL